MRHAIVLAGLIICAIAASATAADIPAAEKIPELAKGLGSGIKEFKKATRDVQEDLQRAIEDDDRTPPPSGRAPAKTSVAKE